MRPSKFAFALLGLLFWGAQTAGATVYISEDRGGRIGTYVDRFQGLRSSGENVVIDGLCASACTLALGIIPRDHLCVTSRAKLGFHQAWDEGAAVVNGNQVKTMVANPLSSEMLFRYYPQAVRDWIFLHGGLPPPWRVLMLSGRALTRLVPVCTHAL